MSKALTFGWMSNTGADGFEQEHGRFTAEVYWDDVVRVWKWVVWGPDQNVLNRGHHKALAGAKIASLRLAADLEKQALKVKA